MASITDIKRRILELAPAPFQEFCDTLISKHGYGAVHGYGMKSGTGNTTIGNPDTYIRKENGKYVFVAYTIQQNNIYSKLKEDIEKCLDSSKTGLDDNEIDEIICCHTSSNLSAGDDKRLHDLCEDQGIALTIWGIDELANQVHNHYRSLAKDYLGLSIDTNQILSVEDFILQYDANGMAAPLNTLFRYREIEKKEIIDAIEQNPIVVVTGKAGVGKTRIVLESIRDIALEKGYKILCVKNNNLGLYEDLVSATEQPDKYLFFIDDANELAELSQILAYTTKRHLGYEVKIIVTVRDYVKAKVLSEVKEYTFPVIIQIPPFKDEEIKGFLSDNLEIRNETYVKQIIRIAEGNPRIAYMAGRLAIEKQDLAAIKDVSQVYDAYYEKYVNGAIGSDSDLCFTVGVLSVVNAVVLNDLTVLKDLLEKYGITFETFKDKILQLSMLEVVEIQLDQVATLSDQCLANYMLYYVFFEKRIIPFSVILETGYKHFRNGVKRTINTLLNIFESDVTRAYCRQEILTVWDIFKGSNDTYYDDFVKDFHVFRPEEAFLQAQQIIDSILPEKYDVHTIDFSNNVFCHEESVLAYLEGYQYSDYLEYVIEMLLDYCSKTANTLVSGCKWLENYYGMEMSACNYKYYNQKTISKYVQNAVLGGKASAMAVGFHWAKYSLEFSFHCNEMGRGNIFTIYTMNIKQSDGLVEYRSFCWEILVTLAANPNWKDKVLEFLDYYARNLRDKPDRDIVSSEIKYVEQILSELKCGRVSYLKAIQRLFYNGERMDVKYNEKWIQLLNGKEWSLYQLLDNDYVSSGMDFEEFQNKRTSLITEYGKKILVSEIPGLIKDMNSIILDITDTHDAYCINQGFELIVQQFDEAGLHEFIGAFIKYGGNLTIRPRIVLEPLNKSQDFVHLLSFIKQTEFPQKNEWLFDFFDTLPEDKIDSEMLHELFCFLRSDSDKTISSSSLRCLRVLDKFLNVEPNVYAVACAIILEKRKYSSFIVQIYFELLFHDQIYTPKELLLLFRSDIALLQEMYFYMLKVGQLVDLKGTFLTEFLELGDSWIQRYSEAFWEHVANHKGHDKYRNSALWKTDDYQKYFDHIFYHFPEEEMYRWRIGYGFKDIMTQVETDDIIKQHQSKWLEHIIIDNVKSDKIIVIFTFVCELGEDVRKKAIQIFLDNNQDYETFSKLSLIPNHWSGSGSFIPAYQKQIEFLESLDSLVPGVKFLKHKARIKAEVEMLQEMIKREEVEEICRNLYM